LKFVFVGLAVKVPVGEIASQLVSVHVDAVACAVAEMLFCAATVSVCAAGFAPPATALNVSCETLNVSVAESAAGTFNVTVADRTPEAALIEISPLHFVPAASPVGSAETVKVVPDEPAVKLPDGEIESHVLLQLSADTAAVAGVSKGAVTVSVCGLGATPPTTLNVSEAGDTVSGAENCEITFSAIGTVCVTEPAVTVIVALQVVPAGIPP
jgi:hypothetical protein